MVYEVTGVAKGDITYTDGGTQTTQHSGEKLPWKKSISATDDVIVYQVLGQNSTSKGGEISCKITIDGKVVAENTSSGVGAIATCEHTP